MKKLLSIFFLSSTLGIASNTTSSTIKEITVYLSGAQVTRNATINLPEGTSEFVIDKLSSHIDEQSIQISGLNDASVISINYGINYLVKQDKTAEIETIQKELIALQDKIQIQEQLASGYYEELKVIQDNRALGNNNQVVNLEKLQQFTTYYRKRTTEINALLYETTKNKNELNTTIKDLQKQLIEFNVDDKVETGEIKIKLNSTAASKLNLVIKYNVTNAGWFPIYDIKANKLNKPLHLNYKAHIYQNTGVNWDNIKLTLSTSDPNTNNIKPELQPKYLNFINRYTHNYTSNATKKYNYKFNPTVRTVSGIVTDQTGSPLPGVNVIVKGTSNGTTTDFDGKYYIQTNGGQELAYSFVGMVSDELPIHSSVMNVSLNEDASHLDEVVVVAYGISTTKNNSPGYNNKVQNMINDEVFDEDPYIKPENFTSNGDYINEGIANTTFEIKKAYSIPTNGDISIVEINSYEVPANYSYFSAPIINENVFLTAKIGDWSQYNLLPAEANVYFEGSFSGKTHINPMETTDSLTISLGVDPNVIVKRIQPQNFKKNAFIGTTKTIQNKFEIEVKNNKSSAIHLVLVDRIPLSQNKDIKIDDIETGTSTYNDKKGILEWNLNLNSNSSKTMNFSYSVRYPKYKRINL
jgi:hypothetical protein